MTRFVIAALLLVSFIVGCTPMPRFTNPPGSVPITGPREERQQPKPIERRHPTLSRIEQDKMNHIIAGYMTTPYQRGGSGVLGLDCSGFVYVVYRDYDGTRLPLTVESLYRLEDRVQQDDLSPMVAKFLTLASTSTTASLCTPPKVAVLPSTI
jgi:hypothetical protein